MNRLRVTLRVSVVSVFIIAAYILSNVVLAADPDDWTWFIFDHANASPGDTITALLSVNSVHDLGGYGFVIFHQFGAVSAVDMTFDGTRAEGIEPVLSDVGTPSPEFTVGHAIYWQNPLPAGIGPVANVILAISVNTPRGSLLSLTFKDIAGLGGLTNEAVSPDGVESYFPEFNHGTVLVPLEVIDSLPLRGDANGNQIPYEPEDLQFMVDQLVYGTGSWTDELWQTQQSDANYDSVPWTIADLLTVDYVIKEWLPPSPDQNRSPIYAGADSL